MVNITLERTIRDSLITEGPAVIPTTEEMIGTKEVGTMMVTIERAADMVEVMIETVAIGAAGRGAEASAVAVAEARVLSIGDVEVVAVPEIVLDVIVILGVVLRIVIRTNTQVLLTEWVHRQECSHHLLHRHHLVVPTCQCRWDNKCQDSSQDKHLK
jgi:hypothetical protein